MRSNSAQTFNIRLTLPLRSSLLNMLRKFTTRFINFKSDRDRVSWGF
jgi:hypothetical protein